MSVWSTITAHHKHRRAMPAASLPPLPPRHAGLGRSQHAPQYVASATRKFQPLAGDGGFEFPLVGTDEVRSAALATQNNDTSVRRLGRAEDRHFDDSQFATRSTTFAPDDTQTETAGRQLKWEQQAHQQRQHCRQRRAWTEDASPQNWHPRAKEVNFSVAKRVMLGLVWTPQREQQCLYTSPDRTQRPYAPAPLTHADSGDMSSSSSRYFAGDGSVSRSVSCEVVHSRDLEEDAAKRAQWKKARRKEQCRVNQANYRRRKRQHEVQTASQISELETEIEQLKASKEAIEAHHAACGPSEPATDPLQAIGDFYFALEAVDQQQQQLVSDPFRGWSPPGASRKPALQSLLDLQREEFDSTESLQFHWLWYCEQFERFHLHALSSERLEVGDQVLIRIIGELYLEFGTRAVTGHYGKQVGARNNGVPHRLMCPVLQQFEFDDDRCESVRVTSEIDLVAGAAAALQNSDPVCTLCVLQEVARAFADTNGLCDNF